jgi:hypothetical protein
MAIIGLVHLAERLFHQTQGNPAEDTGLTNRSRKAVAAEAPRLKQSHEFRPASGNAAHEAGLFQVSQASVFTAAATALLVEGGNAAPALKAPATPLTTANGATAGTVNNAAATAPAAITNTATTGAAAPLAKSASA